MGDTPMTLDELKRLRTRPHDAMRAWRAVRAVMGERAPISVYEAVVTAEEEYLAALRAYLVRIMCGREVVDG